MVDSDVVSETDRTRIHASFFSLAIGAIGALAFGVGSCLPARQVGFLLQAAGSVLMAVGITVHLEHATRRIGRPAVMCGVLAALLQGFALIPGALDPARMSESTWIDFASYVWGASALLAAAGLAFAAIRKERLMEAHLATGRTGSFAVDDYDSTIHASFLSLLTGGLGFLLLAIGMLALIDGGGPADRRGWILQALGGVLLAVALISHIEHLAPSIGHPAIVSGALFGILQAVGSVLAVLDPVGANAFGAPVLLVVFGCSWLAAGISLTLIAARRRAQDTRT